MRAQKYTLAILFVLFLATIVSATPTTPTVVNLNVPASGINSGQNFEVKFAKDISKKSALKDTLTVKTKLGNTKISSM